MMERWNDGFEGILSILNSHPRFDIGYLETNEIKLQSGAAS
jgi:hypothetical protein